MRWAHARISHLVAFVVVAQELHFRRASQRLFLSQPSLSRQMKQLELDVDTVLLIRTTRRVELTSDGEILAHRAGRALRELGILGPDGDQTIDADPGENRPRP